MDRNSRFKARRHIAADDDEDEDDDNNDDGESENEAEEHLQRSTNVETNEEEKPVISHRFQHSRSILCLAATDEFVYAGTQSGHILVRENKSPENLQGLICSIVVDLLLANV